MGAAQKNLAVVGVLVIAVGGGLWVTQGDRSPVGHARGESAVSERINDLQVRRDELWSEGLDCTPILISPQLISVADLGIGLEEVIRISVPEQGRVIQYDGPVWEQSGWTVDARVDCVRESGEIVIERSEGPLSPVADATKFGTGWSKEELRPNEDELTNVGDFFPTMPFVGRSTEVVGGAGVDQIDNRLGTPNIDSDGNELEVERPNEREMPERGEER